MTTYDFIEEATALRHSLTAALELIQDMANPANCEGRPGYCVVCYHAFPGHADRCRVKLWADVAKRLLGVTDAS